MTHLTSLALAGIDDVLLLLLIKQHPDNAGASQRAPVEETAPEVVDALYELNVKGTLNLTRAALPMLLARGSQQQPRRIVIVGSMAGQARLLRPPTMFPLLYSWPASAFLTHTRVLRTDFLYTMPSSFHDSGFMTSGM